MGQLKCFHYSVPSVALSMMALAQMSGSVNHDASAKTSKGLLSDSSER